MLYALYRTHFTIGLKLHSQVSAAFFRKIGKSMGKNIRDYNDISILLVLSHEQCMYHVPYVDTCAQSLSLSLFPYVLRAFVFTRDAYHETRHLVQMVLVQCMQVAVVIPTTVSRSRRSKLFRVVYRNFTTKCPTFFYEKPYAIVNHIGLFFTTHVSYLFFQNVLKRKI